LASTSEQHLGRHLAEAIQHALHAEVRRARGEHRAEAGRGEHDDDRFGHVGQQRRHAIARHHAQRLQRLRNARNLLVKLAVAEPGVRPVLGAEHDGAGFVARAQQVLREIEPRVGEETRPGHALAVGQDPLAARLGNDAGEIPQVRPEGFRLLHRPAVERVIVGQRKTAPRVECAREARQVGGLDAFRRRAPEGLFGGHHAPPCCPPPRACQSRLAGG